ncbi:oxygen-independent coproporphyrinogen III oxidase [Psychrobacter sp. FDAARGOS_221]|uniref:oxygen-independent coproporphyrinogen III oxidase n=1 Tax=Psychrobacter sp. FDAARGOS_221 TaxID=1975705 RepID=UPI000BB55F93|nr:oxygen-independent coproporphyrinogen III oxidase [Psychrobacter sp. FDAARGOS_221]PNK60728.1 oxygen-independent coproporphyrinogen III oxidase [Psychrobacter sp. FDAARGOS_221]
MTNSSIFTDQADLPPTTQRPDFTPANPYARRQFDDASSAMPKLEYDDALIHKYNRSGPRYTSYPTALEFKPIEAGAELDILTHRDAKTPLSLYFHIPFCRHLCYYCACNKIITKKNSDAGDYLDYLKREIKQKQALLAKSEPGKKPFVKQLHLGGGTPTFFNDDELIELWQFLQTQFEFDAPSEQGGKGDYSIEVDPRELRETTLEKLRELGFNRVSFGVQDLDHKVQIAVNRVQSEALIQGVVDEARRLNYNSINIDLIYGLPHQTPETFAHTVARIIEMGPDRLSIFNYAHLPDRFKAQKQIKESDLPSPAEKLTMFKQTITALTEAGYQYIGIDHFAKPDDELAIAQREGNLHRNFQGYTILGDCDLLGFGVSAISQINSTLYSSSGASASHILQNNTDLDAYRADIDHQKLPAVRHIKTNIQDRLRGYVIMNLLCHDYIDFKDVNQKFGIDAITYFINEIQQLGDMQQDKLIDMDAAGIRILPKGRLLARNVAMAFDTYLAGKAKGRFSKVI